MNKDFTMKIEIKVKARDQIEANQKFMSMLSMLQLLRGYTIKKQCDSIYDNGNVLDFNIRND